MTNSQGEVYSNSKYHMSLNCIFHDDRAYYKQSQVTTCDLSKRDELIYDAVDTDHEYEGLDNYSKTDGEIKMAPSTGLDSIQQTKQLVTEAYEYTDCPAYIPVTTQVGGNTESDVAKEEKSCT